MDSYHDQLVQEIGGQLDALVQTEQVWNAQWITHAICADHIRGLADSRHRIFWE